jgi:hypothetical protein
MIDMHALPIDREKEVLDLWDRAVGLDRWCRDQALLAGAERPPLGLGARNLALLATRSTLFGPAWSLRSDCPACGEICTFDVDSDRLRADLAAQGPSDGACHVWDDAPVTVRSPIIDDLIEIAREPDTRSAALALLRRCVSLHNDPADLDDAAVETLGQWLEEADPAAVIAFLLTCPACEHAWSAPVDVAEALWAEVQHAAERFLLQVDALARAYGWSEDTVMRLSPTRRAAYLQLVGAA